MGCEVQTSQYRETMILQDVRWCGWVGTDVAEEPAVFFFGEKYWTPKM